MNSYKNRISRLCEWMTENRVDTVVIEDAEERRNSALRYFSGMPSDSVLFIFADKSSILLPWDMILAEKLASTDIVRSYSDYERSPVKALGEIFREKGGIRRAELFSATPHLLYKELAAEAPGVEFVCRGDGVSEFVTDMRAVKDAEEIAIYREAAGLTDRLIKELCGALQGGRVTTELDAAMLIERASRELGAEGPGFETIAAGPERSWGIHAFPAFSAGPIGGTASGQTGGLSIIDCGLRYKGYVTDITLTVCSGKLNPLQEKMVSLVEKAAETAAEACVPGSESADAAAAVDQLFKEHGMQMPHSLGHGIGLDVHEKPYLKNHPVYRKPLLPGMVFTIEPGLYDAAAGGVRLEDDYLMTESGAVRLTSSRIMYLR